MSLEHPNRALETKLRHAIMESLHELVPEFRAHVRVCASCEGFHEWMLWRHAEGTNEWHAECPTTGVMLTVPLMFPVDPAA